MKYDEHRLLSMSTLDMMYGSFLQTQHTPTDFYDNLSEALTFIHESDEAKVLSDPRIVLKSVTPGNHDTPKFVILKVLIPYSIVLQLEDFNKGIFFLSNIKNQILKTFAEILDISKYENMIFDKPRQHGTIFKESDSYNGVELRAVLIKKQPTKTEGEQDEQ